MKSFCRTNTAALLLAALLTLLTGCGGPAQLMPTPNVYARAEFNPFAEVPPELQNNKVDVLYVTDRKPEKDSPTQPEYGFQRSRSAAFGIARVEFGKDVSWDDLVAASRSTKRSVDLPVQVTSVNEIVRFLPTPRSLVEIPPVVDASGQKTDAGNPREEVEQEIAAAQAVFKEHLARTPVKEVYVFVHGYANTFYDSATTIAQLWHFFGRRGVPVAYSWPAGHGGLLRGYNYDRESSEFTVYHLKQTLRAIAEVPEVKKIHLIAHSRGTDVLMAAVRELHLEISGGGKSTREVMKMGTLVLAAPDMDFDVVIQRLATARLGKVPEHSVIYICAKDEALGISNWLFSGASRLGTIQSDMFPPAEIEMMRKGKGTQVIDAHVSDPGMFGHNYFHSNPAVSSDLILLIRYGLAAGADHGRPLRVEKGGFWIIDNEYPGPAFRRFTGDPGS